jgi:hypothetical protein
MLVSYSCARHTPKDFVHLVWLRDILSGAIYFQNMNERFHIIT